MNYFADRKSRTNHAKEWTKLMEDCYADDIACAVSDSEIIDDTIIDDTIIDMPKVIVKNSDSVKAAFDYYNDDRRVCILNFASFKNPGGKFYEGSSAQEESLCHNSTLYSVLKRFTDNYYTPNMYMLNKALYKNRAIYSKDVLFFESNEIYEDSEVSAPRHDYFDVLTCACPNKAAAQKYQNISNEENLKVLKSRIKFVLDTAEKKGVKVFILGAYGCGVFGQDPYEVARVFKDELQNRDFSEVVFPIPGGDNLKAFEDVFKDII